jgi:hypothetical protein
MPRLRAWLRPPRNHLILFGVVLLLPAAALIALGVRLLDQDRALARQREGEILEHAADQGVRSLDQDLAALRKRLAGPPCASRTFRKMRSALYSTRTGLSRREITAHIDWGSRGGHGARAIPDADGIGEGVGAEGLTG